MHALERTTRIVLLTLAALIQSGCVSWNQRVAVSRACEPREVKINTARMEENRGHLEVAKKLYEEIRQQEPSNAECLHRLGVICTRLNQHSAAEVYFHQANALRPNDPEILADMGYAAFVCKKYSESEALLEQSVKLRDSDRRAITNLAIVLAWDNKDEDSLGAFRRVFGEAESLRNLEAIQVARGDKASAAKTHDRLEFAEGKRRNDANTIAQTASNDVNRRLVVDVPPVPTTPTMPESIAPLPPLPVISPNQPGSISATIAVEIPTPLILPTQSASLTVATMAMPAVNCSAAFLPPDMPNELPGKLPMAPVDVPTNLPSPAEPAPAVKDDYSASLPPSPNAQVVVGQIADEVNALVELEEEIMYQPIVATERFVGEASRIDLQAKLEARRQTVWRKTDGSRTAVSEDPPVSLAELESNSDRSNSLKTAETSNVWSICLVTLFEEKRLVPGAPQYSMEYQSQQYRFSTQEALEKFREAPHVYVPVAGGLDVVAVRNKRHVQQGALNFALWYHRKLYLFSCAEHAQEFRRQPEKYEGGN